MHTRVLLLVVIFVICTISYFGISADPVGCGTTSSTNIALRLNQVHNDFVCKNASQVFFWRLSARTRYTINISLCNNCSFAPVNMTAVSTAIFKTASTQYLNEYLDDNNRELSSALTTSEVVSYMYLNLTNIGSANMVHYSLLVTVKDPCYDNFENNDYLNVSSILGNQIIPLPLMDTSNIGSFQLALCENDTDFYYLNTNRSKGNLLIRHTLSGGLATIHLYENRGFTTSITPYSSVPPFVIATRENTTAYLQFESNSKLDVLYLFDYQFVPRRATAPPGQMFRDFTYNASVCTSYPNLHWFEVSSNTTYRVSLYGSVDYTFGYNIISPNGDEIDKIDPVAYGYGNYTIRVRVNEFVTNPNGAKYAVRITSNPLCSPEDNFPESTNLLPVPIVLQSNNWTRLGSFCDFHRNDYFYITSKDYDRSGTVTITILSISGAPPVGGFPDLDITIDGMSYLTPVTVGGEYKGSFILRRGQVRKASIRFPSTAIIVYKLSFTTKKIIELCPTAAPVKCPSGLCVSNVRDCIGTQPNCPPDAPFRCYSNLCVRSPSDCRTDVTCPEKMCWNGKCADDIENECPLVPACPFIRPLRCWNGCFPVNSTCPPAPCLNICEDGTCQDVCPSYTGCPLTTPFQCPTGECATNQKDCQCGSNLWMCADKTCVEYLSDCKQPYFQTQILELEKSFLPSEELQVAVPTIGGVDNACFVTVPPKAIEGISSRVGLRVKPVPQKLIKLAKFLRNKDTLDLTDILSPVVNLKIVDGTGEVATKFAKEIAISCVVSLPNNASVESLCLAFINTTTNSWQCEDKSLSQWNVTVDATTNLIYLNGTTRHFTSFAVLLGDEPTNDDEIETSNDRVSSESVSTGVIIAVVVCAGVVVIIGLVGAWIYMRKRKEKEDKDMEQVELQGETTTSSANYKQ